jgi:sodium-dependent phosphate transporter
MSLIPPPDEAAAPELYWMAIAACIFGFAMSFGIGANDVGNCFATTVAAKSLSLTQAVGVAAVFEFAGAALLGASVTKTIRSGILDMDAYEDEQDVLAFGMLVALVNASFWLILATAYGLPVSTTHTIIAAIVGFSLAARGFSSIMWGSCAKIFISWVAAPAITGIIGYLFFFLVRTFVLKSDKPFDRSAMSYSLVIFITLTINIFFVLHKGLKKFKIDTGIKLAIAFGASFVIAVLFQLLVVGWLKRRIVRLENETIEAEDEKAAEKLENGIGNKKEGQGQGQAENQENGNGNGNSNTSDDKPEVEMSFVATDSTATGDNDDDELNNTDNSKTASASSRFFRRIADATYNRDLEKEALEKDDDAADIWNKAEKYDEKSEILYSYLQVFTACALSFAHGSNDVANAVAPICAVLAIYDTGILSSKAPVPQWVLVMGAFGIVTGLALFGYKVIISIGYRLTKLSPSRGFCIQLSTTLVVVTASYAGIPVSTTQSTIGGTIGVGAVEGKAGVQWLFMLKVFFGWVASFFITCLTSAGIMAFCYYSPSSAAYSDFVIQNVTVAATAAGQ